MSSISKLIGQLMTVKGVSQAQLAERSSIHRANLCRFLSGEVDVRTSSLIEILKALEIDLEAQVSAEILKRSNSVREFSSPGEALDTILACSDTLTIETVMGTLNARLKRAPSNVRRAVLFLQNHATALWSDKRGVSA